MTVDEIKKAFETVGFWVNYVTSEVKRDVTVFLVADRCILKNKETIYYSMAFNDSEMMEGYARVWLKITTFMFKYNKLMEPYGGFERADTFVQARSSSRKYKRVYREGNFSPVRVLH